MKKLVIGIDVSKEKLDFCLQLGERVVEETVVENTTRAIVSFLKGVLKSRHLEVADLLLCAEYRDEKRYVKLFRHFRCQRLCRRIRIQTEAARWY
jgi:hypothetical protein